MQTNPFQDGLWHSLRRRSHITVPGLREREGTSLTAFAKTGKCYKCKTVSLAQLYNTVFTTTEASA